MSFFSVNSFVILLNLSISLLRNRFILNKILLLKPEVQVKHFNFFEFVPTVIGQYIFVHIGRTSFNRFVDISIQWKFERQARGRAHQVQSSSTCFGLFMSYSPILDKIWSRVANFQSLISFFENHDITFRYAKRLHPSLAAPILFYMVYTRGRPPGK